MSRPSPRASVRPLRSAPHRRTRRAWPWLLAGAVALGGCKSCREETTPEPTIGTTQEPAEAASGALCWHPLDQGLIAPEGAVDFLDLGLAAHGETTWLAWSDRGLMLRAWTGQGPWSALPPPDGGGFGAARPVLAVDEAGRPLLAWEEDQDSGTGLRVARLVDGAWQQLGGSLGAYAAQGTAASDPVLLGGNEPVVAWTEIEPGTGLPSDDNADSLDDPAPEAVPGLTPAELPGQALWAAWWDGKRWETGRAALTRGSDLVSFEATAARDETGTPWITWIGGSERTETFVRVSRRHEGAWQDVGGTARALLKGAGEAHAPRLVSAGPGQMLLVWRDGTGPRARLQAARWSEGRWERVQAPVLPSPSASIPTGPLMVPGGAGEIWAAWTEAEPGFASTVTLAAHRKGVWERRVTGLNREGTPEGVRALTLVRSSDTAAVLAWDEPSGEGTRMHVVRATPCAPGEQPAKPPAAARRTPAAEDAEGDAEQADATSGAAAPTE